MKTSLLLLVLLAGCATHQSPRNVPFVLQKPNHCGPAALAMVAGYYGRAMSQDDLPAGPQGVLTIDLLEHARRLGFWARQYRGNFNDLRDKLTSGVPLIVRGRFGNNDHFFLVQRYDAYRQLVIVHTDSRPDYEMSVEDFRRFWDRGGWWTLLVCPPERATWHLTADEHNDLGIHLERTGQLVAAAGHYRLAADLARTNSYYAMNLGNALAKQKLMPEAAQAYRLAVQRDPANADALNNLAWAYGELGANLDEAVQYAQRAIELQPARRAHYLDTLGGILLRQGRATAAVAAFQQALAATTERQSGLRRNIEQRLAAARALSKE